MRRRTHGGKGTDKIGRDPTDCGRPARGGCGIVVCVGLSSSISDRTRYAFRDSSASGRKGVKIFEHYYLLHKACHGLLPRTRVANSPKSDTFLARLAFLRQDAPGAGTPHLPTKREQDFMYSGNFLLQTKKFCSFSPFLCQKHAALFFS